jgi:hypothetical protein
VSWESANDRSAGALVLSWPGSVVWRLQARVYFGGSRGNREGLADASIPLIVSMAAGADATFHRLISPSDRTTIPAAADRLTRWIGGISTELGCASVTGAQSNG